MAKLVNLLVHCAHDNSLATEYLAKIVTGKFLVGAKRVYNPPTVTTSGDGEHDNNSMIAHTSDKIIETTNGVTWDCLHCQNTSMYLCTKCMTCTCHTSKNAVLCAGCNDLAITFTPLKNLDINEPPPNDNKQITAKKLTDKKGNNQVSRLNTQRLPKG